MPIFKKLKVAFDFMFKNKKLLFLVFFQSMFMQKIVINRLHAQVGFRLCSGYCTKLIM